MNGCSNQLLSRLISWITKVHLFVYQFLALFESMDQYMIICLLKIMSLQAITLHKTAIAIFTDLTCDLPLAEPCGLLINIFEKLHLINSEANLRSPQHLNRSFLWHKLMLVSKTIFHGAIVRGAIFLGAYFRGQFSRGLFSGGFFSGHQISHVLLNIGARDL